MERKFILFERKGTVLTSLKSLLEKDGENVESNQFRFSLGNLLTFFNLRVRFTPTCSLLEFMALLKGIGFVQK